MKRMEWVALGAALALVVLLLARPGSEERVSAGRAAARAEGPWPDSAAAPAELLTPDSLPTRVRAVEPPGTSAPGGARGSRDEDPGPAAATDAVLRVRFVDGDATPIVGVRLCVLPPSSKIAATSQETGEVALALARPGGARASREPLRLELEARRAGFATARRTIECAQGGSTRIEDWVLEPAGTVAGRVLDEHGRGLGRARVAVLGVAELPREATPAALESLWRPGPQCASAAGGAFLLEGVPAGRLRLVAVAEGRAPALSPDFELAPGAVQRGLEIRMPAAGAPTRIAGRVRTPDGRPVARARIEVRAGRVQLALSSDDEGRFAFEPRSRTACSLTAFDPEQRFGEARVDDVAPGTTELELRLARAPATELLVRGAPDGPIESYWAVAWSLEDQALAWFPEEPRAGGRLSFARPSQAFTLDVHANGWLPARLGPFTVEDAPASLTCTLAPAGGLHGRVQHAGRGVRDATLTLHPAVTTELVFNGFPVRMQPQPVNRTSSDEAGAFALSVEQPGDFYLRAEAPGLAPAEAGPLALDPQQRHELDLELGPGGALAIRVRTDAGRGVAGALVALSRGDGRARTWRCDERGELRVECLIPGPWQVQRAETEIHPDHGAAHFGTQPPRALPWNCRVFEGETTRLDLWPTERDGARCRLSGRLTLDGQPAREWSVRLEGGTVLQDPRPLDEPGAFRLGADEPGTYRLLLVAEDPDPSAGLLLLDEVALVEGDTYWSLDLSTGVREGVLPSAVPADGARTFLRWRSGTRTLLAPLQPDPQGRFRHPRAPIGRAQIVRFVPDRPLAEQTPQVLGELAAIAR